MTVAEAQGLWAPAETYHNAASYRLPPRAAWDALQAALEDWHGGRTSWEHWGDPGEQARASFARLIDVPVETVATGATVSTLVGLVAASVPDGSRVLVPEVEFTSVFFPFLAQESRGVSVRLVRAGELAGEIGDDVDIVAFSAVQMATGEVAAEKLDRAGIRAAVRGGRLRTSWHVYNTRADVERTLDVLSG